MNLSSYCRPYEKVEEEPFEIPDSWKWIKLNDLAEIARGGSPRPIQDYITEDKNGINWIKSNRELFVY